MMDYGDPENALKAISKAKPRTSRGFCSFVTGQEFLYGLRF